MTYRDARDEINRFTQSPSHQTIWRYTQELGRKIERNLSADIYFAEDSTKLHSWYGKIELAVFEGENVVVRVGKDRMRTEKELDELIVLGDADRQLKAKERQIDLIHVWREVNYKLWQHDVDLERRKNYVNEVKGILLRLKNSLDKPDLEEEIEGAEKALREFVKEMDSNGYWRVARFFRKHMKSILLFAYKKLEGIRIPWHNNKIERLMGEISSIWKNKDRWSEGGAENLGNLLMKMRFEKACYESFIVEVMKLDKSIKWGVNLHL